MRRTILFLAVLSMAAVACSGGGSGQPFQVNGSPVRTDRVDLPRSLRFAPAVIEISAGTTVTWTNHDQFPHTVKLLDGSSTDKALPIGATTTITFAKAGTILYICSIHPQMHGKILVTP